VIVELLIVIQLATSIDVLESIKRSEELREKFPPNWIVELASISTMVSLIVDSPSLILITPFKVKLDDNILRTGRLGRFRINVAFVTTKGWVQESFCATQFASQLQEILQELSKHF